MTIYIHSSVNGITKIDNEHITINKDGYASCSADGLKFFINKRDFSTTPEEAKIKFKALLEKKKASLEQSIKKINKKILEIDNMDL